ncbi:MAG TPA: ATP-binding protein [Blastocatellia bacterium]|nr:ATP-binding protein [Blastocatellia bacterium]
MTLIRTAVFFIAVVILVLPSVAHAQQVAAPQRILLLYWHNREYAGNIAFEQNFRAGLQSAPPGTIEYYSEYLESNRFPGESQSLLLRDYLSEKYADRNLDVIIAVTDKPLEFLLKHRRELFTHIPIVFVAVKSPTATELATGPGITGIVYGGNQSSTLDLALSLHPGTEQAFIVSGTLEHDKRFEIPCRQDLEGYESRISITYLTDLPLGELIAKTRSLPKRSIILYLWQQSQDEKGNVLQSPDVLALIARSSPVPIYGLTSPVLGSGIVGGNLRNPELMATRAAEIALQIAKGARAKDIPVEPPLSVPMFDWRQLKRWGISEDRLPSDRILRFKELTFWEQYNRRIIAALSLFVLQTLLSTFLLLERAKRQRLAQGLRKSDEERRESKERLAGIVSSAMDAIVTVDEDQRIVLFNEAAEKMFGCPAAEALGQSINRFIPDCFRGAHTKHVREFGEIGGTGREMGRPNTLTALRADGTEFPIEASISKIEVRGRNLYTVIHRDITERKRAEAEREQLAEEQTARVAAEAANRSKDEFLAMVSHELRSPLTAIFGYTRMLRSGRVDRDTINKGADIVERNAKAQLQIIEDLLDSARIITGKLRIELEPIDIALVLETALDTVRPAAEAKGIKLVANFGLAPKETLGDPTRLQQIVWNLLLNSIKFTPEGGRVELQMEGAADHIRITVSDTGNGIEPEFLPFVFDRFRQADPSSTRRVGGLGLGLSLVKNLVELHGGTITAASDGAGRGATFTVTLPHRRLENIEHMVPATTPREVRTEGAIPRIQALSLEGVSVLVVDDQEEVRVILTQALSEYGAQVTAVSSGAEALALLSNTPGGKRPDALILDIAMPDEDGYTALKKVRALEDARGATADQIPAIALSAYGRSEDRLRSFQAGFQTHVTKPVELTELAVVIASLTPRRAILP